MFLRTRAFLCAVIGLVAASGFSGCIIDECGSDGDYWEESSCAHSSETGDDCWDYEFCADEYAYEDYSESNQPSEADCDPMLAAYDECVADRCGHVERPGLVVVGEHHRGIKTPEELVNGIGSDRIDERYR